MESLERKVADEIEVMSTAASSNIYANSMLRRI